jgi:putative ABC transport system permease protein
MREMALRVSIGAGRGRLIQQVLIESGLLALASCLLGGLLAIVMAPAIVSMLSTSRNVVHLDLRLDWRLLAFLAGGGSLITLLFGLAPAIRASAVMPGDALKSGSPRHTRGIGLFRPLVAAQVAFGFVVLFVAGLCLTSFVTLLREDLGFDRSNLALARVTAVPENQEDEEDPAIPRKDSARTAERWRALIERLEQMPGIESASFSGWGLFEGSGRNKAVRIPGRPQDDYMPWYMPVSPGFLETMRIPLVAGRDFDWRDAPPVISPAVPAAVPSAVIVNESFARRYFPGESPLGKRFLRVDGGATLTAQNIIGVARDAKYTDLRDVAPPTVYEPFRPESAAVVQVRTPLETAALSAMLRQELTRPPAAFRLTDVILQSTLVDNHMVRDRALALLSAFFSLVAIVLVVVGLYGVLTYSVVQRTQEIGIRLALGARPLTIVRLVLSEVGVMTIAGLVLGAAGAVLAARFIQDLLFEVAPSDLWSTAVPLTCLLSACTLSALIAARRALRINPTMALQAE